MARVEIPEAVFNGTGGVLAPAVGASVQVNVRDGAATTVYQDATTGATFSNPLTTDAQGRIEGWLEEGPYDLVVSGAGITTYTQRFEAVSAVTSGVARKPPADRMQFVDGLDGDDANDGLSWGSAKATITAARTEMATDGGRILVAATTASAGVDEYEVAGGLDWGGFSIEGISRISGDNNGRILIRHRGNGNLFDVGAKGGQLRNVMLYADDAAARTGAAIAGTSSASNGGDVYCENVVVSGDTRGWERDLVFDGSAWAVFGIRKLTFVGCQFFGCRTAGETIKITRGVHINFTGGFVDQAPEGAVQQGVKILDTGSTGVSFANFRVLGDFYTEAAGDLMFDGPITGAVTCAAGSIANHFRGRIGGAITNSGSDNTFTKLPTPRALVTLNADEVITTGVTTTVPWDVESQDTDAMVALGTDNTKIVIQTPGEYVVTFSASFASNATGYRGARILVNGSIRAADTRPAVNGAATNWSMARRFTLAKTDFIQASVLQTSGGNLNIENFGATSYSASLEAVKVD